MLIPTFGWAIISARGSIGVFLITFVIVYSCFAIAVIVLNKVKPGINYWYPFIAGFVLAFLVMMLLVIAIGQ